MNDDRTNQVKWPLLRSWSLAFILRSSGNHLTERVCLHGMWVWRVVMIELFSDTPFFWSIYLTTGWSFSRIAWGGESITSRTIQLPLPENLDANDETFAENSSLFGRDSPAQWDEYSVPSPVERGISDFFLLQRHNGFRLVVTQDLTCCTN